MAVKAEVLRAVIGPDAVDVVDDLGGLQRPAQDTLHHQAVQEGRAFGQLEPVVASAGEGALTPRAVAAARFSIFGLRFFLTAAAPTGPSPRR